MSYYIYKYVKDDVIEYIGQTTNLEQRIKAHTKDKLKNFSGQIYYFECPHKTAMDSWEYFLINKYHPKYNIALKNPRIQITMDEPEWIKYMDTQVINFSDYYKSHKQSKTITYPAIKSQTKVINSNTQPKNNTHTTIIVNDRKKIKFRCYRCRTTFITTNWNKTPKGYSASCPNCLYSAWTRY